MSDDQLRFTCTMDAQPPADGPYYLAVAHLDANGWSTIRLRGEYSGGGWIAPAPYQMGDRIAGWLAADRLLNDEELAAIPTDNLHL